MNKKLRALAVVLPQFHPIPENDEWWGKGFTEWTNVAKTVPLFEGHYQPHIPADLGFYDLRLEESRIAQADLAKKYGIHGFCYYHYWFHGKQLLERPVNEIVETGKPDFPFCLCWANESWSRNWNGENNRVLQAQEYSESDHLSHIRFLLGIFKDRRYIKVNGRPFFIVYRCEAIPDLKRVLGIWNIEAKRAGFENGLYLVSADRWFKGDPRTLGFDSSWDFLPIHSEPIHSESNKAISKKRQVVQKIIRSNVILRGANKVRRHLIKYLNEKKTKGDFVRLYSAVVNSNLQNYPDISRVWKEYPCVCPGWDNSPRRKTGAIILHGSTPDLYEKWLDNTCEKFEPYSEEENFIFLNAMNEWAEGNHLEPDLKWGLKYLEATKRVLKKYL